MEWRDVASREPIHKGWSDDRKYKATDAQGTPFLLRLSAESRYDRRKIACENMRALAALGVPLCEPVGFGRCEEGVYLLQRWIEGRDAEAALREQPARAQYERGLEAGRILRVIHSLPAPEGAEDWETRFGRKMDRKIADYQECPVHYEHGEAFLECIRANRALLRGRPQTWQHGDYHIGNMMVDQEGRLVIIDFDRDDYGDPWEEFNRIVWCAQEAPPFAAGRVDGYFDGGVPQAFWRLLALYISSNTLSSLTWAVTRFPGQLDTMLQQGEDILRWYDGMRRAVPQWYARYGGGNE